MMLNGLRMLCASALCNPPVVDKCINRYWIIFAFLSLIESAFSVTYWLPFYYAFKFIFVLWLGLPQFRYASRPPWMVSSLDIIPRVLPVLIANPVVSCLFSGAQVLFASFLKPLLAKQFSSANPASAGLRAKADTLGDKNL